MQPDADQRMFNAPAIVVGLLGLLVGVHGVRELLSDRQDDWVLQVLAFVPGRLDVSGWPGEPWAGPLSFFSHALLHGDWLHLGINGAWLLAVGSPVARRMPMVYFSAFFGLCAAGGALLFLVMHPGLNVPMVGASGAISGLMGAVFRLMFAARTPYERDVLRERPAEAARLSVVQTFTNRHALIAIAVWVMVNVLAAVGLGTMDAPGGIAWEAHLGGFFTGLLTFDLFDRGRGGHVDAPNEAK